MSFERMARGSAIPCGSLVNGFAAVELDGRPPVMCADYRNDVWTWDVLGDEWTKTPLEALREHDDRLAPHLYPDFRHVGRRRRAAGRAGENA
ncbi:hypothetical protein ACSNOI_13060 [Actinomadura kijaniata]|uniref:hypothetical protein n=1 Tax=Actinomadura kijaniata TaxID=46161 RepID=UPI003F1A3AE8